MTWWICLLLPFLVAAQTPSNPSEFATLDGQVIQSATQEPVLKARVTLVSTADGHKTALVATTDAVGHFRFADLLPGTYNLTVEKDGFLDGGYGEINPTDNGSLLKIGAGDRIKGVTLRLFPEAVISGRVLDGDGDPLASTAVHLWTRPRARTNVGRSHASTTLTNKAGEYRFDSLPAGNYYVSANPDTGRNSVRRIPVDSTGKVTGLRDLTTYYPGVLSFAEAQAIKIESGHEQPDIDIRVQRGPMLSVKGIIAEASKLSSKYEISATVEDGVGWSSEPAKLLPDGEFVFEHLLPGEHRLVLLDQGANGPQEIGRTDINLTDQDVTGIAIVPFRPAQVRVRVIYEGEEDKPVTAGSVFLLPARGDEDGSMRYRLMQYQPRNGTYVIDDVPPGNYRLAFNNAPAAYLKSIESGGQAFDGEFITVNSGAVLDLKMIFSKNLASVDGDVEIGQDRSRPSVNTPEVQVLLISEGNSSLETGKIRSATLDQTLHFSIGHLPPGKYLAFAAQENDSDLWDSPDFVKLLESEGTKLDLHEGSHATIHLKAISKDVTDRIRQQLGI